MRAYRLAASVLLACAVLAAGGCVGSCGSPRRPNIVIVSIDSLRYDDAFGTVDGRPVAPRLLALSRDAVVFERAYAAAPWTTPSMMAVMTGLPAPAHGVEEFDRALSSRVGTLAERLRAAGYRTAAYVPEATLRGEYGFARGFEVYDRSAFGNDRVSSPTLTGKTLNRIAEWAGGDAPFFVWVHLWDPHFNYTPPAPFDVAFPAGTAPAIGNVACLKWGENSVNAAEAAYLRGRFRGEVAFTDGHLGQILDLLAARGLERDTLVAVIADHGEAFAEHGWLTHTTRVEEEVVHVPLLLHWPGALAPAKVGAAVSLAQLGTTLLDLAGVPREGFGSEPALPVPGREVPAPPPPVVQTVRQGCFTSLIDGRMKITVDHRTCGIAVFDLQKDPGETSDLAAGSAGEKGRLAAMLRARLSALAGLGIPRAGLSIEVLDDARRELQSLGYVAGAKGDVTMTNASCPFLPHTVTLDGLGDASAAACPEGGALRCLSAP